MKKRIIAIFLTCCLILSNFYCFAFSVPVTTESLQSALKSYEKSNLNDYKFSFTVNSNTITAKCKDVVANIDYTLGNNPTFTYELTLNNGISYDVYTKKIYLLNAPISCYLATLNIQGVDFNTAYSNFSDAVLEKAFSLASSSTSTR